MTDLDVVVRRNRFLLIIECKNIKSSLSRINRVVHDFENYADELKLKSKWLIDNLDVIPDIVESVLSLFEARKGERIYAILLLVSIYPVEIEPDDRPIPITFHELTSFCQNLDGNGSSG